MEKYLKLHTRSSVVLGSNCQEKEDTAFELGQTVMYHSAVREREKTVRLDTKTDLGCIEKAFLWICRNTSL